VEASVQGPDGDVEDEDVFSNDLRKLLWTILQTAEFCYFSSCVGQGIIPMPLTV
jgi:hypothetical protein